MLRTGGNNRTTVRSGGGVKATFFVLGSNVVNRREWAANLKMAYDAGHQIA
jgi:hypothetical protein